MVFGETPAEGRALQVEAEGVVHSDEEDEEEGLGVREADEEGGEVLLGEEAVDLEVLEELAGVVEEGEDDEQVDEAAVVGGVAELGGEDGVLDLRLELDGERVAALRAAAVVVDPGLQFRAIEVRHGRVDLLSVPRVEDVGGGPVEMDPEVRRRELRQLAVVVQQHEEAGLEFEGQRTLVDEGGQHEVGAQRDERVGQEYLGLHILAGGDKLKDQMNL